jgi:2-polyprenyl-6-methoxyphenol hydroxylase-like FAD-dependent oxidoreductase
MDPRDAGGVIVVGGGVGGLACALALERAGYRPLVLERSSELREVGAGLLLAANAVRALRMLGVAERIIEQSVVGGDGELRAADGRVLKRVAMSELRKATGEDAVCALRSVLHGALADALAASEVRTNAQVTGFEFDSDGVRVQLGSGEQVSGGLLVGADGIHSIVRAKLHADALRPSGLIAYRGVCHGRTWRNTGAQYFGRGLEAGVARAGRESIYWYVCTKLERANPAREPKPAALDAARALEPAVRELIEQTAPSDVRRDELFDRAPLASWGRGRVTLLGDAAHPMLPHAGQGAAQALEDAVVLGRCLALTPEPQAGLRRYEHARLSRTTQVVQMSRRNASAGRIESPLLCKLRDWVLAHGPAWMLEKQLVSLARVDLERV